MNGLERDGVLPSCRFTFSDRKTLWKELTVRNSHVYLQEVFKVDHKTIFKTSKLTRSKFSISQFIEFIESCSSRLSHSLDYIFFHLVSLASQIRRFNHIKFWYEPLVHFCFIWCRYCHPLASIVFISFVQSERYVYFYDHVIITGCNHFECLFYWFVPLPKTQTSLQSRSKKKASLMIHCMPVLCWRCINFIKS